MAPEFCQFVFPHSGVDIVLIDEFGLQTTCYLEFGETNDDNAGLSHGWQRFCILKGLTAGRRVRLAVPAANTSLICFGIPLY